jgi:hypothetical protein
MEFTLPYLIEYDKSEDELQGLILHHPMRHHFEVGKSESSHVEWDVSLQEVHPHANRNQRQHRSGTFIHT